MVPLDLLTLHFMKSASSPCPLPSLSCSPSNCFSFSSNPYPPPYPTPQAAAYVHDGYGCGPGFSGTGAHTFSIGSPEILNQVHLQSPSDMTWQDYEQLNHLGRLGFLDPLAYDRAAYKLRGSLARLNFPKLKADGDVSGDLKVLHSMIDAKLQASCHNLVDQKPGCGRKKASAAANHWSGVAESAPEVEVCEERPLKAATVRSSSPESDVSGITLTEPQWAIGYENFNCHLEKYPSEIDWAAIYS